TGKTATMSSGSGSTTATTDSL
ncbi:MAG: hypothetical protein JWN17_2938, partial [Frankiales bacterium]|nr:hypothetical protein [Frankiales bacterium]